MTFRTLRDITSHAFNLTAGGYPMGDAWTLPAGSQVILVRGYHGGTRDGFAAGNVRQLKELSGNTHDPIYRYMEIASDNVEGLDDASRETVMRVQQAEAIARGAASLGKMHYALTLEEARQSSLATGGTGWIDAGDFNALPARAALCRTGDGHATVSRDWARVTCPNCTALRGTFGER